MSPGIFGTFRFSHTLVYSKRTHNIQAQLDIFMYIKAYLEYMIYSGIFRTGDVFSQSQVHYSKYYSGASYAYSEPYLGRPRHIQNLGLFRQVMFHAYPAPSNMSLSNILCKTKNFQTWNQKCLICVILGYIFLKILLYLKSAPNQSKCKVPLKDKDL